MLSHSWCTCFVQTQLAYILECSYSWCMCWGAGCGFLSFCICGHLFYFIIACTFTEEKNLELTLAVLLLHWGKMPEPTLFEKDIEGI